MLKGLAVAAVTVVALAGCGSANGSRSAGARTATKTPSVSTKPTPTKPSTITVVGTLEVPAKDLGSPNTYCSPDDGYDDLGSGGSIVIKDASGTIVGSGELKYSRYVTVQGISQSATCREVFSIPGVPPTSSFYTVNIGHRSPLTYSKAQVQQGLSLSIG